MLVMSWLTRDVIAAESTERRSDLRDLKTSVMSAASKILRRDRTSRSESVDVDLDSGSYQERNIDVEIAARGAVRRSLSGQKLEQQRHAMTSQPAPMRRHDVYTAKLAYMRGMEVKACSVDSAFQQAGISVTTPVLGVSTQRVSEQDEDSERQSSFASHASSERRAPVRPRFTHCTQLLPRVVFYCFYSSCSRMSKTRSCSATL